MEHPGVKASQHLRTQALEEKGKGDCMWTRALMPVELYPMRLPAAAYQEERFPEDCLQGGFAGEVATDGSGGKCSADPLLRR